MPLYNPQPVPLTVALGGTGDTGAAWTSYSPTVTATSGSFTSVSATGHYKDLGKTRLISVAVTVTTVGTAATSANIPLPNGTAAFRAAFYANDVNGGTSGFNGAALIAVSGTGITWAPGNGGSFEAGHVYVISGTIEMT